MGLRLGINLRIIPRSVGVGRVRLGWRKKRRPAKKRWIK